MADTTKREDEQAMTLRIPAVWHDALREKAFRERRPMADIIREAIKAQLGLPCECCEK